jgi:gamma-glutamyltranspeptidase/glutathione hydrolase
MPRRSTLALLLAVALAGVPATIAAAERTPGVPARVLPDKANGTPPSFSGKAFRKGVVAVSHPLAAEAGAQMLEAGGNAIDAAAAIQFALNVVEPEFSGIGGGGFMMIHIAKTGETFSVDGREKAPATADTSLFLTAAGTPQSFNNASQSGQAVGVPGTLMAVSTALDRWGRMSLADTLQPAITLAEDGHPVNWVLANDAASSRTNLYEPTRSVFRPGGTPVTEGYLLKQPMLAHTFRLIADQGPDVFYEGVIAPAIVAAQQQFIAGGKPGLMTVQDLANYNVVIREPITTDYRGYTIASMGPPSSGGLTVAQVLELLEPFPIGDASQGFGFGETKTIHAYTEALRLAWADRAVWMGDEDFVPVPKRGLLHPSYVDQRQDMISLTSRMAGAAPFGNPWPYENPPVNCPLLPSPAATSSAGGQTTHFSVVDKWGNVVSFTTTIEAGWGTGIMVPGYGFMLNNELTDFNFGLNPHPCFGGPGANDVQGGKRPRSSMSPSILFKDGEPIAAYGSPGGATIINSVLNVTLNLIDHDMAIKDAVEAPRISVTSATGAISREPGLDPAVIAALQAMGHTVNNPGTIGNVNAVVIDLRTGKQYGAVDSSREGGLIGLPRRGSGN